MLLLDDGNPVGLRARILVDGYPNVLSPPTIIE